MRERLTTLVCALGALLLIGTLLLRGDPLAARRAAPPTTLEHSDNGLLGARHLFRYVVLSPRQDDSRAHGARLAPALASAAAATGRPAAPRAQG